MTIQQINHLKALLFEYSIHDLSNLDKIYNNSRDFEGIRQVAEINECIDKLLNFIK